MTTRAPNAMSVLTRVPHAAAALTILTAAGCGGHHLADYDFAGRSVAVVYFATPAPDLRTGSYGLGADTEDPVGAVLVAGGRIAREVEARKARARLDSAASRLDLSARMAERTLERASRYLGARPVEERGDADFLLEVDIRDLGLDARRDRAYLFVSGEAVLLNARNGREIWDADISSYDALTPDMVNTPGVGDVLTAGALRTLSVAELERMLGRLADFTADRITRELRGDLRDTR
jgi:hypothetical protein